MKSTAKNISIFFVLIALLLSTANLHAFSLQKLAIKKVEKSNHKPDFKLKAVSMEATVNAVVSDIEFFTLSFLHFDYTHIIYKSVQIIEPLFENSFLKILFSRIIPTKAP